MDTLSIASSSSETYRWAPPANAAAGHTLAVAQPPPPPPTAPPSVVTTTIAATTTSHVYVLTCVGIIALLVAYIGQYTYNEFHPKGAFSNIEVKYFVHQAQDNIRSLPYGHLTS